MEGLSNEYTVLFNGVTDAINSLESTLSALKILQQKAEELYIEQNEAC